MKTVLRVLGAVLLLVVLAGVGGYIWATRAAGKIRSATYQAHRVDFPIPTPLDSASAAGLDPAAAQDSAQALAVARGRHLVSSRYACGECHGDDLGGGTMIDAFPMGTVLGPNLTLGTGSVTAAYTAREWDWAVRHGILPDGRPSMMPSEDFARMSDQELGDIVSYIRSLPAVDRIMAPPTLGPVGKVLVATSRLPMSVSRIASHDQPHPRVPPPTEPSVAFGAHLAATCTGCHGANLAGGPITAGDPSWPPARNLTSDPSGLGTWEYQDFVRAMREGIRKDGTSIRIPMTLLMRYAQAMSDIELEAIWVYLRSLPPVASKS